MYAMVMDDSIYLECPKCGRVNENADRQSTHFECGCGCVYDYCVCDNCEEEIASRPSDEGICPECGELHSRG